MSEAENTEATPEVAPEADADLVALLDAQEAEEGGDSEETDAEEPEETDESDETETETEEDAGDTDETTETKDEDPEKPEATKEEETEDPELKKRLDKIQAAEKRQKENIAKEREDVKRQIEEYKPKIEALENFNKLKARVRSNPVDVLRELGITDDDLVYVSKQAWRASPDGSADPKNKELAADERRRRLNETELQETRRELAEVKEHLNAREAEAKKNAAIAEYMGTVEKAVSEASPLVARALKKNPEVTRADLRKAADRLAVDEIPDHGDVVKALEESYLADLKKHDIDPETVLAAKKETTEETSPPAGKKKTAKTLSNDLGKKTKPRKKARTQAEEVELLLAEDWPEG